MDRIETLREQMDRILLSMTDVDRRRHAYMHLYGVSQAWALLALKRGENAELATMAGMLHDVDSYAKMDFSDHANQCAQFARELLIKLGITMEAETKTIYNAIYNHDDLELVHSGFE